MSQARREFNRAVKETIGEKGNPQDVSKRGVGIYAYPKEYSDAIRKEFEENNVQSRGLLPLSAKNSTPRICVLSSSARLCYLGLKTKKGVDFEKKIPLDSLQLKHSHNKVYAHLDALTKKGYVIAKAGEVVDGEHEWFPEYYKAVLVRDFGVDPETLYEKFVIRKRWGEKPLIFKGIEFDVRDALHLQIARTRRYPYSAVQPLHIGWRCVHCGYVHWGPDDPAHPVEPYEKKCDVCGHPRLVMHVGRLCKKCGHIHEVEELLDTPEVIKGECENCHRVVRLKKVELERPEDDHKHEYVRFDDALFPQDLHFNLRQLIADLVALSDNGPTTSSTLRHLIYLPTRKTVRNSPELKVAYRELKREIRMIFRKKGSARKGTLNLIKAYAKDHRIKLKRPKFIRIKKVKDPVLKELVGEEPKKAKKAKK